MKRSLLLIIAIFLGISSFSQTVLFEDNFDALTAGQKFVLQADQNWWDTWSNAPGGTEDGVVSDAQSNSPSNSIFTSINNDIILKLGDRASGEYEVEFYMYIATANGAYFNTQHFESPGSEWAYGVYFDPGGSGYLTENSIDHVFSFPHDSWFKVVCNYDLDNDEATVEIDGVLIGPWTFSNLENGGTGANRLGCIDIFSGYANHNFYFDDVKVTEISPSSPPIVNVSVSEITSSGSFSITNDGVEDLQYEIYPIYPASGKEGNDKAILGDGPKVDVDLTHISGNVGFYAYLFDGVRVVKEVVKMPPSKLGTLNAIGLYLNSVICYIGETSYIETVGGDPIFPEFKLKIWDRGSLLTPGPGDLLVEQVFTPTANDQNNVVLDNPIYIDGRDLWFGFEYEGIGMIENVDTLFTLSRDDDSTPVADVNYVSLGVGWQEEDGGNLGLIGLASGTSQVKWVNVTPKTGTILSGANANINVTLNSVGLTSGEHHATLVISTTDPVTPFTEIPITLTVVNVNDINSGIMTYPNPVNDQFTIVSDTRINRVVLNDLTGKLVQSYLPQTEKFVIDMSSLSKGIYIIDIETDNQTVTRKVVVE